MTSSKPQITIKVRIDAPLATVWESFTSPQHIMQWNFAAAEWHCPHAENDLREGGRFKYTMAARDGSMAFDFEGMFTKISKHQQIQYLLDDQRTVQIDFAMQDGKVLVTQTFEAESQNSLELQETGWQAILENFRIHTEQL